MPLLDELSVDVSAINVTEMEEQIKAGPIPPEGLHHAVLRGFREGTSTNTNRKFRELVFEIIAGPAKGMTVKESLWNSDEAKGKNRVLLFAHRLGVLKRDGEKLVAVPGINDFGDVIDKAQCFIDIKHKKRTYEKDGEKRETTDAILSFEGILSLDDKRAEKVARVGAVPPSSAAPKPKYAEL
jgi:hypothetical protein